MKYIKNNYKKVLLIGIFAAWFLFNGILLAGHELWRDEANVWLLARDTSPLELIRVIKYQGHPCLWYFLMMPFAKLGFPFPIMSIISFVIMSLAAGFFTFKSTFQPLTKAVCLFSPILTYYYPVVARNYCLIALLLILLAYFYTKRNEKSLGYGLMLGLLVQADTIAIPVAGLISCMWLWEGIHKSIIEKKSAAFWTAVKGLWIPLASLGFWVLQFAQVSDSPEYRMEVPSANGMLSEIRNFSYMILTRMTGQGERFDLLLILLFLAAGILLAIAAKNLWPVLVMAGGFLFEVIFSIVVYQLHIWHYITIGYMLFWGFWVLYQQISDKKEQEQITDDENGKKWNRVIVISGKVLTEAMLILLGVTMFLRWNAPEENSSLKNAWDGIYSDAVNVAEYIEENVDSEEVFAYTDVAYTATVQAYLGKDYDFRYAGSLKKITYASYTEEEKISVPYCEFISNVREEFSDNSGIYLLLSGQNCINDIPEEAKSTWTLCYQTQGSTARGEEYTLYYISFEDSGCGAFDDGGLK